MHPSSSSSSSSSTLDWTDWVPDCLQPAMAIASELPFHLQEGHDEDDQELASQDQVDDDDEGVGDGEAAHDFYGAAEDDLEDDHDEADETFGPNPDRGSYLAHHHYSQEAQRLQQQHAGGRGQVVCVSCKEVYCPLDAGTCRECYEEASETEEVLKKEIEDLNARIAFLKTWTYEAMSEAFTDIVLETSDGSKIRAHQAVLISRSPVFKAMLDAEMEESRSGTIKISDFSYEILRLFVHYLYTADIHLESLEDCAFDLLALAEKYNVKQLKNVCEQFMMSKLNSDNALFSYEYACQHGAKTLKEAALTTVLENIHELTSKDEYHELVNRDAKMVVEIYEAYLAKKTK